MEECPSYRFTTNTACWVAFFIKQCGLDRAVKNNLGMRCCTHFSKFRFKMCCSLNPSQQDSVPSLLPPSSERMANEGFRINQKMEFSFHINTGIPSNDSKNCQEIEFSIKQKGFIRVLTLLPQNTGMLTGERYILKRKN